VPDIRIGVALDMAGICAFTAVRRFGSQLPRRTSQCRISGVS
jgi:hypothetical protein